MTQKIPEILAPVATLEMCQAAIHNGADAIYLGMPYFNARGRTSDLSIDELKSITELCHLYGVKVFIALNILIFQDELQKVTDLLREVITLSPDAFIVQDIGLIRLIKKIAPHQTVHASTQMTVTNYEAINLTADLDIARYVLGREVSIGEMQKIRDNTDTELEVFVHGALCVSYSGQCLTSERIGGRSANRGQCAQSCRMPYDLIVDGEKRELGEKRYLVSPQDLCALGDVAKLQEIGIDSFKIEGRLKSPEYVASTVKSYKDKVRGQVPHDTSKLETVYSRGFFNGWMEGVNHQQLVNALYSNHHGRKIGIVTSIRPDSITLKCEYPLSAGEGLVFCDFTSGQEFGSQVYEVRQLSPGELKVSLANSFELEKISSGMTVFCNSSPKFEKEVRATFTNRDLAKRITVDAFVSGAPGEKMCLSLRDQDGNSVTAMSSAVLQEPMKAPLTYDFVKSEIAALSGTCFELGNFNFELAAAAYIHQKEIKELRRSACKLLLEKRSIRNAPELLELDLSSWYRSEFAPAEKPKSVQEQAELIILLRDYSQIDALENFTPSTVYLDFEFGKEYEPALKKLQQFGHKTGIATTRILKPGETGHLKQIVRLKPDVILVRNLGALYFLRDSGIELVADFSLNVTNSLTAKWLLSKNVSRFCPSYDLNQQQLMNLLDVTGGESFEVTIHQYMPAFHMEHCVFAAFLSNGSSYRDCGRPCEKHRVELRDTNGAIHPLKADAECRNTMFHGIPQSSARLIPDLISRGVQRFRFEALYETAGQLRIKLDAYLKAVRQKISTEDLFEKLQISEKYGVSEGQIHNIGQYRDRKKALATIAATS